MSANHQHELQLLDVQPLTKEAFAPFGDVVELDGAHNFPINGGSCIRYHDLAQVQLGGETPRALVSLARAQPRELPIRIEMLERHPLGSQAFIPLPGAKAQGFDGAHVEYLIVVAPAGDLDPTAVRAFLSNGWQGVNYHRGVWHHPLLALHRVSDFLIVDRGGPGHNCDEQTLPAPRGLTLEAVAAVRERMRP